MVQATHTSISRKAPRWLLFCCGLFTLSSYAFAAPLTLQCPLDSTRFNVEVASLRDLSGGRDSDGCCYSAGAAGLEVHAKDSIFSCPKCQFSAPRSMFSRQLSTAQIKQIQTALSKIKPVENEPPLQKKLRYTQASCESLWKLGPDPERARLEVFLNFAWAARGRVLKLAEFNQVLPTPKFAYDHYLAKRATYQRRRSPAVKAVDRVEEILADLDELRQLISESTQQNPQDRSLSLQLQRKLVQMEAGLEELLDRAKIRVRTSKANEFFAKQVELISLAMKLGFRREKHEILKAFVVESNDAYEKAKGQSKLSAISASDLVKAEKYRSMSRAIEPLIKLEEACLTRAMTELEELLKRDAKNDKYLFLAVDISRRLEKKDMQALYWSQLSPIIQEANQDSLTRRWAEQLEPLLRGNKE